MGACNPSDRMREAAASDVEEFFIVWQFVSVRRVLCDFATLLLIVRV